MQTRKKALLRTLALGVLVGVATTGLKADQGGLSLPANRQILPAALAAALAKTPAAERPLLLHVGFHMLYVEAHIPGSVYAGPANAPEGLKRLKAAVAKVSKSRQILLYCGCCPWDHCPNIAAAYHQVRTLGFKNVKVLHLEDDFGTNWADPGYPVAKGE